MATSITRRYHCECAHWLPGVPETHKCHRIHGHNYVIDITVKGVPDPDTGFVIDFWDLDKIIQPIIDTIDHRTLNDIPGLQNPTAEHIATWFWNKLFHIRPETYPGQNRILTNIRVYETPECWCDYTG